MSIADAKAVFGLSAVGTGDRPWISQSATIGLTQTQVALTDATIAFVAEIYLQGTDVATLDLSDFSTTIDAAAALTATSTLTLTGNAVAAETVTIGDIVYTWRAAVSTIANEVKIGATASDSLDNLIAAITAGAGSGTVYGSLTTANPLATAAAGAGDTMIASAVAAGALGNGVATTETMTNGSWSSATTTGGKNANAWIGASLDFQGDAFEEPTAILGFLVQCESGDASFSNGSTYEFEAKAGERHLRANPSGAFIADLTASTLTITATADFKAKIAILAS